MLPAFRNLTRVAPRNFSRANVSLNAARAFSTKNQAFKVYRYDPESGEKPKMVQYDVDLNT